MFDTVRNNRRFVQIFLVLITLPFAFWGVESYVRNVGAGGDIASVGDSKVTGQDLQQAMVEQQDRLRETLGSQFNPAMLDTPEARRAVLDSVINQRLLGLYVAQAHLGISDVQLHQIIASAPALQVDGKFSTERYDALVAAKNTSREGFEARLRRDMSMQQVIGAVVDTGFSSHGASNRWLAAQLQEREISEAMLKPEQFSAQVKLADDAIRNYYDGNRKQFETPEQLRAEYLVLSQDLLATQVAISDEEIKSAYKADAAHYAQAEERRASHILVRVDKSATPADIDVAKAKAAGILAEVQKSSSDFAKLAKQNSQDPGSAEKGGDLGWISRGMMVKPFEDSVFSLQENQTSDLVRSDFGFHIIRVTGIKPGHTKSFEQVRDEIAVDLKRKAAAKKYAEIAEGFSNTVYEQSDSLKPAAEKYGLTIQQSAMLTKGTQAPGPFGNAKLNAALFSDDAVKNKRNTEAVEVSPNTLVSARVLEYKPASLMPIDSVKTAIEQRLVREEAAKLAHSEGEAELAKLNKGEAVARTWSAARTVPRMGAANMPPAAVKAIFQVDAAKLPAYAGVALPDGSFAVYRINKDTPYAAAAGETPLAGQLRQQYTQLVGEEDFSAWLATLRQRFPVVINKASLESKERPQ